VNAAELRSWVVDTVNQLVMTAGIAQSKGDPMRDGFESAAKILHAVDLNGTREEILTRLGDAAAAIHLSAAGLKRQELKSLRDIGYALETAAVSIVDRLAAEKVN